MRFFFLGNEFGDAELTVIFVCGKLILKEVVSFLKGDACVYECQVFKIWCCCSLLVE